MLKAIKLKRKSLFIFDNAEKSEELKQFLPLTLSHNNKPYVLITSRMVRQEWEQWEVKEGITLDVFTDEEAISFVKEALKIDKGDNSQDNETRKLAIDVLHKFPLALVQAVAHIKEENRKSQLRGKKEYTIVKYLEDYKKEKKKLLNSKAFESLDNDYEQTTLTTLEITVGKIKDDKEYGGLALKILYMIAYFAPNNIPVESFFLKLEKDKDEKKLWEAVELLYRYSMIKLVQGEADIHLLVQEVTRINLKDQKREEETLRKILELIKGEEKAINPSKCIFYPCTEAGKLSNIEVHAAYIWSYAAQYGQLVKDFYSAYGENRNAPINLFAITGRIEAIKSILKNIEKDELMGKVNDYNQAGYAPIHSAAFNGHKDIVEYFIKEQGVGVNFGTCDTQNTPTFVATLGNQLHIVEYLVCERGADPNQGGKYGTYPIHYAALYARKDFIKYLVQKNADILVRDENGSNVLHFTLLHLKRCREHLSDIEWIVKHFLKEKPVLAKSANFMGMTPLHFAAEFYSDRIIKMLLDCGADVNARSCINKRMYEVPYQLRRPESYDEGYTPLHIAAKENHLESVKLLLKHGAIYSAINDARSTSLDIAEFKSDVENLLRSIDRSFKAILDGKKDELDCLLKGKDSDVLKSILNARNNQGNTLLQFAIVNKHMNIASKLLEILKRPDQNLQDVNIESRVRGLKF